MEINPAVQKIEKKAPKRNSTLIYVLIFAIIASIFIFYYPAFIRSPLPVKTQLYLNGKKINSEVFREKGETLLPASVIKEYIDPYFYYDKDSKTAVVTTKDKVLKMKTDKLTGYINKKEVTFNVPMREKNGQLLVPLDVLSPLYNIDVIFYEKSNSLMITDIEKPIQRGIVTSNSAYLREKPKFRSYWITKLTRDEIITIVDEDNGWLRVITAEGFTGYVKESKIQLNGIEQKTVAEENKFSPWRPLGEKIVLTWDYAYCRPYTFNNGPSIEGANVVSPTWFHLEDKEGNIRNIGYKPYIEWAHNKGYQVWALFSNSFDPDLTRAVLSNPEKRARVRDQLLVLSQLYDLDGINFDFENIYYEDKELYVQFIRELVPFLHEQGLTVSVDVTVLSGSKRWSLVYDRKSLAKIVDYMMVMAYDQYPRNSSVAGPVASLHWTENKLKEILQLVPHDKVMLGIPFYTRLWREYENDDGTINVTSQALGMDDAEKLLKKYNVEPKFDPSTGLLYGEYKDDGYTYKIWLENEDSIRKRIEIAQKYALAGIASWRRGFEKEKIWEVIEKTIERVN